MNGQFDIRCPRQGFLLTPCRLFFCTRQQQRTELGPPIVVRCKNRKRPTPFKTTASHFARTSIPTNSREPCCSHKSPNIHDDSHEVNVREISWPPPPPPPPVQSLWRREESTGVCKLSLLAARHPSVSLVWHRFPFAGHMLLQNYLPKLESPPPPICARRSIRLIDHDLDIMWHWELATF